MTREKEILKTSKTRKLQYLVRIMRNKRKYHLLENIVPGKAFEKGGVRRKRVPSSVPDHRA